MNMPRRAIDDITWPVQASAAGKDVPWMAAHCGHVLVPAHHEVFVVDDLHKDARRGFGNCFFM